MKQFLNRFQALRLVFLLIVIGLGLVSVIGTGGGSSSGDGRPTYYHDGDGDGYGDSGDFVRTDTPAQGYVADDTDCNDADAGINPGMTEVMDDGVDQNCNGFDLTLWFQDADGDGYGNPDVSTLTDAPSGGYVTDDTDCDDTNADIYPGACPAPKVSVTVNSIPAAMNGSRPYLANTDQLLDFTLAVPTSGFVWNVLVDSPCGCRQDDLEVWTDPPAPSGSDPADFFESDGKGNFSWLVNEADAFDETDALTLKAAISDKCGQQSAVASLTVKTVKMEPQFDPFDLQDPWLFVYSRDYYTISIDSRDGTTTVISEAGPNGVPDFIEDLWTIGLGSDTPHPVFAAMTCKNGVTGNECLARMILEKTREKAYRLLHCRPDGTRGVDGVNVRFWIENEPGAPDPADFAYQSLTGDEAEKTFSMMGFGGGNLKNVNVSLSEHLDYWNRLNEDNTRKDFGVLTTSLARYIYLYLNNNFSLILMASLYLDDIFPPAGGRPIGVREEDARVIDLSIPDGNLSARARSRRSQMMLLIDAVAEGLGALAVHELGHSVGLVPSGHPPYGFFGGEKKAAFIENPDGSTSAHIDTVGYNIMQAGPGSGYMPALSTNEITDLLNDEQLFFFNEINLAYLQRRLLLLP